MSNTLAAKTLDSTLHRGIRLTALDHSALFCLFLAYGFVIFGGPFWYLMQNVLSPSLSLAVQQQWFSPPVADGISIHYAGFGIPLVVAIASTLCCYKLAPTSARRVRTCAKLLLVAIPLSVVASQLTLTLSLAGNGSTDPFIVFAFSVYLYVLALRATLTEAALLAYPLGFLIGLLADLESLLHLSGAGVFGGYGFADGDFILPLAFVIATILFAKTWRRMFKVIQKIEALATRIAGDFFDELE